MNEGAYRDQKKICGFCHVPIGSSSIELVDGSHPFHRTCWKPFEEKIRRDIKKSIIRSTEEKEMRWNKIIDGFWEWFGKLLAAAVVGVLVWVIVMWVISDDAYKYCQIEGGRGDSNNFELIGVRDWGLDDTIGKFGTVDEAKEVARKMECDLR